MELTDDSVIKLPNIIICYFLNGCGFNFSRENRCLNGSCTYMLDSSILKPHGNVFSTTNFSCNVVIGYIIFYLDTSIAEKISFNIQSQ